MENFVKNLNIRDYKVYVGLIVVIVIIVVLWRRFSRKHSREREHLPQIENESQSESESTLNSESEHQTKLSAQADQLFSNKWVFYINPDKCTKYNFSAPLMNRVEFRNPTANTVDMLVSSDKSSGTKSVDYRQEGDTIVLSQDGNDLFAIEGNKSIRLLEVERRVTNGEPFKWPLQLISN